MIKAFFAILLILAVAGLLINLAIGAGILDNSLEKPEVKHEYE